MNIMLGCDLAFCYNVHVEFTGDMGAQSTSGIYKMTKRILAFMLTIVMILIVSACSRNADRSSDPAENSRGTDAFVYEEADTDKGDDDRIDENEVIAGGDAAAQEIAMIGDELAGLGSGTTGGGPSVQDTGTNSEEPVGQNDAASGEKTGQDMGTTEGEPVEQNGTSSERVDQDSGVTDGHTDEVSEADGETEALKDETEAPLMPENGVESEDRSKALEGRIICIDPGHQTRGNYDTEPVAPGSDEMKAKVSSGTAGVKTRIPEYKLVLEVALKLRDALEGYGATVIMTRTENNVDISNAERAAIANDANADLYFRIHADGSTDKSVHGVSVLIPGKGHITDEYVLNESEKAGSCILEGFVKATGAKRRGLPKRNDLSGFNWCRVPMALIEIGFMSNAEEDVKMNSKEYQDKMVEGMANGIVEHFMNN